MTEKSSSSVTIYHNPACATSRSVLALIRNAGIEPTIVEYLKAPPDRATLRELLQRMGMKPRDLLRELLQRMGMKPRDLLREKGTPYGELGLSATHWTDEQLIDQMVTHPLLINRPIVVTGSGARLCRPAETVKELI